MATISLKAAQEKKHLQKLPHAGHGLHSMSEQNHIYYSVCHVQFTNTKH